MGKQKNVEIEPISEEEEKTFEKLYDEFRDKMVNSGINIEAMRVYYYTRDNFNIRTIGEIEI